MFSHNRPTQIRTAKQDPTNLLSLPNILATLGLEVQLMI